MKSLTILVGTCTVVLAAVAIGFGVSQNASLMPAKALNAKLPGANELVVARAGNQVVTPDEVKALFATLPAEARSQLRGNNLAMESWLRSRLAEKVVLERAEVKNWASRPEVVQQTRAASEQVVLKDYLQSVSQPPAGYPSEAEIQKAYDAGKSAFQIPVLYRVSQIFLAADQKNADVVSKEAQELSKKAQNGPDGFAELATQYSQDLSSAQRGGDIGSNPLEKLLPEVRETVVRLKVGEVAESVRSAAGFHVIKLTEQRPAHMAGLEEVRDYLIQTLRAQKQEQLARIYVDDLIKSSVVSIDYARLNKTLEEKL